MISKGFDSDKSYDLPHLRSASDELANIQVSPSRFPNREPSGSVSMICFIAFPTSPVPPVTRTTFDMTEQIRSRTSRCWVRHY